MKLFVYCFRDFDERQHFDALTREAGIDYSASPDYPTAETAHLAAGCEAISFTPCRMDAALLRQFRDLGVKYELRVLSHLVSLELAGSSSEVALSRAVWTECAENVKRMVGEAFVVNS